MIKDDFGSTANVAVDDENGGVWVDFHDLDTSDSDEHNQNLAETLDEGVLSSLASQLLLEIEDDDRSRAEWLTMREKAIGLLGVKVNPPRGDVSQGAAPIEGMSSYQDSALLEASVRFQANARGELLPSGGPVKVYNDGDPSPQNDAQAEALEKAVNEFLTVTSTEYVPDTDRLFFQVGWSGAGFKKGYHCPIRRRPVIESIDAKDLIVSNQATDIDSASRVTHVIKMSRSVIVRMQIAGAYRDVSLALPNEDSNVVDKKIASIQGVSKGNPVMRTMDRTLYECYADLDIPGFEHKLKGKITGLPIPYKVTIDKASRTILEIRRNWREEDEQCIKRKTFVLYPFIPAFGLYPLGLMHLLGNATNAITAALRVIIDNGMFNNFPGFLFAKSGIGQDKNDFRMGPGQGVAVNVDVSNGSKITDKIMPLPYKPVDGAFVQFIDDLRQTAQRLGGTAEVQVGEGDREAPVGTTVALIEQATKVMSAVHKRLHQAQAEEFRMLQELLQEDPEALWRHKGTDFHPYNEEILRAALNNYELVPQADPNIASHMMRMTKAEALKQLVMASPNLWNVQQVTEYYLDQIGLPDAKRFIAPPPPPGPAQQDPNALKAGVSMQAAQLKSQDAAQDRQFKLIQMQHQSQENAADRQARMEETKLNLAKEVAIHPLSQAIVADSQQANQPPPV